MTRLLFGSLKTTYIKIFTDLNRREFAVLIPLFVLNLYFGICPNILIETCYFIVKRAVIRPHSEFSLSEA
jgi:NADH:ubiquinone oxidoreductase subunit 4 (subunit M)